MSRVMQGTTDRGLPHAWRQPLLALVLLLLALGGLFFDTLRSMVEIWQRSETFAHAFIVPPIALWLIWRRRHELAALQPRPDMLFLIPLALTEAVWLLGEMVATNSVTQLTVVLLIILCVPAVLGRQVAWRIAFPLGFLLFSVPLGEFMLPMLMEGTADFTVMALRASGIPVYREGLQFVIPSGNWSVVEACSGVRYLIASLMVGTLFAYMNFQSMKRRFAFIGFAIVLPVVANWIRAYGIVMLGHLSGNKLAVGVDHLIYGWVFFGVVMLAMFMIGARWSEPDPDPAPATSPLNTVSTTVRQAWLVPVLALALLGMPPLALRLMDWQDTSTPVVLKAPELGDWVRDSENFTGWRPVFESPAAQLDASYRQGAKRVGLHLAYYRHQGHDSKLITSQNVLVHSENKQWARTGVGAQVALLGQQPVQLSSSELRGHDELSPDTARLLVWQFYWINGRLTSSDIRAKLHTAASRLMGRGDDSASVIVYAPKDTDNAAMTEQLLQTFLQDNWGRIEAVLQAARRQGR